MHTFLRLAALAALVPPAVAQSFAVNTTSIPSGIHNNSTSENVDFADVDGDGDPDALFADGGDNGNDRNRLWINQGGLQGGTPGVFVDDTINRLPSVLDTSRDVDFADIDLDGDPDVFVSNTSSISNQTSRWWINQGGAQGGTAGFFTDETATTWINLGVNNGTTTFSSIAPALLAAGGGYIDWIEDSVLADLDSDGDPDLVVTTMSFAANDTPARLFLNDGAGHFEEFNPSGFQLLGVNIANGDPALWAQGVQQNGTLVSNGNEADIAGLSLGVEAGDLDGDFDVDLLVGDVFGQPRLFANRMPAGGALVAFRDVTHAWFTQKVGAGRAYEQELGDLDRDGDLDVYGTGWGGAINSDVVIRNDGSGTFGAFELLHSTQQPGDNVPEWIDYDGDGELDVYSGHFSGQDRLYGNSGGPTYTLTDVTASELPTVTSQALAATGCDVDGDGDTDVFLANDNFQANTFLENVTGTADAHAPRIPNVEQVPNRVGATAPAEVRAHVYDNASWKATQHAVAELAWSLNGGPVATAPMTFSGGQVFRGEIPAAMYGTVQYSVQAADEHGNLGVSAQQSFSSEAESYCTAGLSASGCEATLSALGAPSAAAATGFVVSAANVEGGRSGLFFFGTSGRIAFAWGNGTSFKCVAPPTSRGGLLSGTGTSGACDGTFAQDLNARWTQKPNQNPGAGAEVQLQLWYRDPQNTSNRPTSFSDAIEFLVGP